MPAGRSQAEAFFEQIRSADYPAEFLSNLINSDPPTFETEWLDFKCHPGQEDPSLSEKQANKKLKEMWSKALSGFANTGGGVLIWGIDARKETRDDGTQVDAAIGKCLLPNPDVIRSRLQELHPFATDPPVAGVEMISVVDDKSTGGGYLACLIPAGTQQPYRAESADRQYYHRAGDSFLVASRPLLALLFYPRVQPRYGLYAKVCFEITKEKSRTSCHLNMQNAGSGTAEDIVIQLFPDIQGAWQSSYKWTEIITEPFKYEVMYKKPLHPGQEVLLPAFSIEAGVIETWQMEEDRRIPDLVELKIRARIYSRHCPTQIADINFSHDEIALEQPKTFSARDE